jgi:PAS domain S-box-containing protein
MTVDPQVLRAERHLSVAEVIRRDAAKLIERWAERSVLEQPRAARLHHQTLLDHLPRFLRALSHALAHSEPADTLEPRLPALQHGAQRWAEGWSLPELIKDYQILRLVVLEHLEKTLGWPIELRALQAIGLALDEAIATSVAAFIAHGDEYVRRLQSERAEHRRLAEEARLAWERVFHHAGWGIALTGPNDDLLHTVNPAFARLHGYDASDLVNRPLSMLLAPESQTALAAHLAVADREGHHRFESVQVRRDSTRFPALAHISVIPDVNGRIRHRAFSFEDITGRKQLEQSLRDRAEVLRDRAEMLRNADRRKNEFLAMLAHELRNPLAPIQNAVEMLRLLSADPGVSEAREVVERQLKQMVRLVEDLLDATRIAEGKLTLRRSVFDLAQAVGQAVQTVGPLYEVMGHRLSVSLPDEPLRLEADEARIVQVLVNLLNNAGKYSERSGQIELTVRRELGEVVVRVRDQGVGIDPEMLPRVFDLFAQADQNRHRSRGGLGIGLTLVRQLVELHGGSVSAHSEGAGQGSEFVVRLPCLAPAAPTVPSQVEVPLATAGRHILIVEDNADARDMLAKLLSLLGHRVEVAANGPDGVEKALALRPQVALIDLGLPGMDGVEVVRAVRAALGDAIRLVALTGHAGEENRRRALQAGFDAHLAKPVELDDLTKLLAADVRVDRESR